MSSTSLLDHKRLQIYTRLLGPLPEPGAVSPKIQFTEEGRAYYGGWFRKFGFELSDDPDVFFDVVRFILRSEGDEPVPYTTQELSEMLPAARAVAESLNRTVLEGACDHDFVAKLAAARQERTTPLGSGQVLAFKPRSQTGAA